MTQREKLLDLIHEFGLCGYQINDLAGYLLSNGVVVLPSGADNADELTTSILHCLEIANNESICEQCKQDHLQLASWLTELSQRREEAKSYNRCVLSFDRRIFYTKLPLEYKNRIKQYTKENGNEQH